MLKIYVCGTDQLKNQQGIHLIDPDLWYLQRALDDAERDMFESIFIHVPSKGQNYRMREDVLAELFRLAALDDIRVETVNPCFSDQSPQLKRRITQGA